MQSSIIFSPPELSTSNIKMHNHNWGAALHALVSSLTSEDAANDGGDTIDTFSSYVPMGLQPCIVQLLKDKAAALARTKVSTKANKAAAVVEEEGVESNQGNDSIVQNNKVIEILDLDNEDDEVNYGIKYIASSTSMITAHNKETESTLLDANSDNDNQNDNIVVSSHTLPSVKSALLSSVSSPIVPDEAATIIYPLVQSDKLSPLQAEGALLAIHRFQRMFWNGTGKTMRAGEGIIELLLSQNIFIS